MRFVSKLRELKLHRQIERCREEYEREWTNEQRLSMQLNKFNIEWEYIIKDVPYFKQLVNDGKLPTKFVSWEEFIESIPPTTRSLIQKYGIHLSRQSQKPDFYRITGGSTAQPIQLPSWNVENKITNPDTWLGRSWYGISPKDKLFLLWGHSHLLGTGIKGFLNARIRELKDWLLSYQRFSAYDLSARGMRRAAECLLRFKPDYIIGYSVALDAFARINLELTPKLRKLGVKAVIGAAEGFPKADSEELLREMFNCPVGMEYGSVESGLIGHTHPNGGYQAFWQNYFVEAIEEGLSGGKIVRLTSLYRRCFPLIRYEIGDEIDLYEGDSGLGVWRFKRVIGRCNDFIFLSDGTKIHSEAFTHCLRESHEINGYQVIQSSKNIIIRIISNNGLSSDSESKIRRRLGKIHPSLEKVSFEKVSTLEQTIAGKTRMIIRKE